VGGHWHLDKRVNVSIIVALIAQAALGLTWANQLTFDVRELKKDLEIIHKQVDNQQEELRGVNALQGKVVDLAAALASISTRLDTLVRLSTQMDAVMTEIQEVRREYRSSNRRLWDETRNLRNAITSTPGAPKPETATGDPTEYERSMR
jgi:uncharacterized coiled-coil DUF342 family protein